MLKSLEISGFKSFAKKTELNFKSRVTAIVGPNGSGKSNVAEAFRFVLGEQSMKSMRGKRGEDLIWNGSTEVGRSNRASVKLVFDNVSKLFNFDFDEVIIERVVNRDGSNEYFLNGSQVRLKDIFELLSQAHVGASGHHIISQGEADRVLSANTKERREMIEDALGLKIYQYKREESERKLLKTEENIKQVESLRREIAPHIKFLKKQVERVEKAEDLRQKLAIFYKEFLKREKIHLEKERDEIEKLKKPLERRLAELEKQMEEAKSILNASARKDEKSEELLIIENRVKEARTEKDHLSRELGKLEGEIAANDRAIERAKTEHRLEESKMVPLQDLEELEREVSGFFEIPKILERIRNFILNYKTDHSASDARVRELELANLELQNKKSAIEKRIAESEHLQSELHDEYEGIKASIESEKNSSREAEKAIFKISLEQSEMRAEHESVRAREHALLTEENNWKREMQEGGVLLGTLILGFEDVELAPSEETEYSDGKREQFRRELEKMKIRLEELGGGAADAEVMREYRETVERDEFLIKELGDLKASAESLEILIKELLEKLDIEFKHGIEKINRAFQEFFALMFGGGNAKLEVVKEKTRLRRDKNDFDDEINKSVSSILSANEEDSGEAKAGIDINVSLPRKKTKGLDMLSGGERALTSIALLFAISQVNPPPFIILDETDAALDEANSKKYGDMIENLSKYSQLIIITHNRETMSRAGVIYGVTMGRDSVSRLLSIAFDEAVAVAK